MGCNKTGGFISGLILVLVGIWILTGFPSFNLGVNAFHLIIGVLFLVAYFSKKAYGFLIPGCILIGTSLGGTPTRMFGYSYVNSLYVGLSFIMIYVIDKLYRGKTHWWPLIPGTIISIVSIPRLRYLVKDGWPILLILLGLYVMYNSFKSKSGEDID